MKQTAARIPLRHSLRFRLVLAILLVEVVMLGLLLFNSLRLVDEAVQDQIKARLGVARPLLDTSLGAPLFSRDLAALQHVLAKLTHPDLGEFAYLVVYDDRGQVYTQAGQVHLHQTPDPRHGEVGMANGIYDASTPLTISGELVGEAHFGLSLVSLMASREALFQQGILIGLATVGVSFVLMVLIGTWLTRSLRELLTGTRRVATGDYGLTLPAGGKDEIGLLASDFNAMTRAVHERIDALKQAEHNLRELNADLEQRVADRTQALQEANAQLQETVTTLRHAQEELVRIEKLASLGALVAGVAHELNTPLGNSLTVATSLQDWTRDISHEAQGGTMRRSALNDYLHHAEQAAEMLTRNLFTASELISQFKQVAVDQTSEQYRPFDLAETVHNVVTSMQPQYRKTPHRVEVEIPAGLVMNSYPGPLGQVVSNLVLNALIHAFTPGTLGLVRISARVLDGGRVGLSVADDGQGIPPRNTWAASSTPSSPPAWARGAAAWGCTSSTTSSRGPCRAPSGWKARPAPVPGSRSSCPWRWPRPEAHSMEKPHAPSCDRNREPILAVLRDHFTDRRQVLEIGSGTGQHAVYFAAALPHLTWQASDRVAHLPGIRAWLDEAALPNTPPPLELDVSGPWPPRRFDAVFSANCLHIMAWEEVERLFSGLPAIMAADFRLVVYGPFNYGGRFTSESNAAFEVWLKERGPHQGIRDFEAVEALARGIGLELVEDRAMPANNRCLVWRRASA